VFWSTPQGEPGQDLAEFVGLGASAVIRTEGPGRVREARRAIERIDAGLEATDSRRPRFWGGLAFAPGRSAGGCWEAFGECLFLLPRWHYEDAGAAARLGLVFRPATDDLDVLLAEGERLCDALSEPLAAPSPAPRSAALERRESTSEAQWTELVNAIRQGIERGEVHKVVAARRSTLRLSPAPDPAAVFERLGHSAPACTRFAVRVGARTFLGATPERLARRRGRQVTTHAIAGSIAAGEPFAAEKLLASAKDRAEHEYVVAALREALAPLCDRLELPEEPRIRQLRHVLHLETPVAGTLSGDVHLLELVERLHPTPAVGGVPTARALEWIARHEPAERGWYASPVGWLDAAGDGDMVVALRSALLLEDRVHLYAGAGIVAGSEPGAEYAETEVKLAGMRAALGVGGSGGDHAAT
jgi:isochorismate synthase